MNNLHSITTVCSRGRNLTLEVRYQEWLRNTFANHENMVLYRDISRWKPIKTGYYVTPIIVGSGPSLVETIDFLKQLTYVLNPLIISTYAAVPFLMHHGIRPHGIILLDSHKSVLERWNIFPKEVRNGYFDFICASHCDPEFMQYVSSYHNLYSFKSFSAPSSDSKSQMYNNCVNIMTPFLKSFLIQVGDSVNAALLLVDYMQKAESIQFDKIILVGVDHSWNKDHLRVPLYTDNGLESQSSWIMKELPFKEPFPGIFTDDVLEFYDEEMKAIRDSFKKDDNVSMYVLSSNTLSGKSFPVYQIGE